MPQDFALPSPLEYFRTLVQEDDGLPLLEAAASLAQDQAPDLDLHLVTDEMDLLAANYYDPQNSFIHAVLRTRRGIPISLAVVWLDLAERVGLSAHGVSFPGHFMIKVGLPQGQVILDPMTGQSLTREDLLERMGGNRVDLLGDKEEVPMGLFLQSATPREILERMLRNLKEIYASQQRDERELAVQNRLLVLLPDSWADYRERGKIYALQGAIDLALGDLTKYLNAQSDAPDAEAVRVQIAQLQAKE